MALRLYGYPLAMEQMPRMRFRPHRLTEESEREYVFSLVLPGVDKDQVETEVVGHHLVIKAHVDKEHEKLDFKERFNLPKDGDHENLKAELVNGVLKVTVPKVSQKEPTKITVGDEGEAYEDGHTLTYRVPGVGPESISVHVTNENITVKADADKHGMFRSFEREYSLPHDARVFDTRAICKNGVLTVSIPTLEAEKVEIVEEVKMDDTMHSITLKLPGIDVAQITLQRVKNQFRLTIQDTDEEKSELFTHAFNIPRYVDSSKVVAGYKNGLLTIAGPKKTPERHTVAISVGEKRKAADGEDEANGKKEKSSIIAEVGTAGEKGKGTENGNKKVKAAEHAEEAGSKHEKAAEDAQLD